MPAIQPTRLRQEAAELAAHFDHPAQFIRELENMLAFYADRTRRTGHAATPGPLLPAYQVPAPVLRAIIRALAAYIRPDSGWPLPLADALWANPGYEHKMLAAYLLGALSPEHAGAIFSRVIRWAQETEEDRLLEVLFQHSIAALHAEDGGMLLATIKTWLRSNQPASQILALRALVSLVEQPVFKNLPAVFTLLTSLGMAPPTDLQPYLRDVLQTLARRSPHETAYFLENNLKAGFNQGNLWLTRQVLGTLPADARQRLRAAMQRSHA